METPQTGTLVGQYVLEEKLGEGGMAEVWRARNTVLGHSVAMKFLTRQFAGDAEMERRFLDEGKRQAMLQHRNIVSAFDFLYVDGRSFLVMRYIKGETLEQRLFKQRGPMALTAVLGISKDVLCALDYAHSQGIVHRDMKPSNILIENTGAAYVLDFGIALALGEQRVTRAGVAIGTPHYMSPQQIMGSKGLDHRTDVYSYGCVLYQMLTLRPPFDVKEGEGDTEYFVKDQHLRSAPQPPHELNPAIPAGVEGVVLACLEKDPDNRFHSCQDLLTALEAAVANPDAPVRKPSEPARTRTVVEQPVMTPAGGAQGNRSGSTMYSAAPTAPVQKEEPVRAAGPVTPPLPPIVEPVSTTGNKNMLVLAGAGVLLLAAAGGGYVLFKPKPNPEPVPKPTPIVVTDTRGKDPSTTATTAPLPPPAKPEPPKTTTNTAAVLQRKSTAETSTRATRTEESRRNVPNLDTKTTSTESPNPYRNATPPPTPAVAQSGVLQCAGAPVGNYGTAQGYLFRDLPRHLQFQVPANEFHIQPLKRDAEHQDVLVIPLHGQTSCSVPWTVKSQ